MSLRVKEPFFKEPSRKLEKASVAPSPTQPPSVKPAHPAEVPDTSTNPQHGSHPQSPNIHYLNRDIIYLLLILVIARPKFEDLAGHFEKQDSIDDVVNWNQHLLEQLGGNQILVDLYNLWSQYYFMPPPRPRTHRDWWQDQIKPANFKDSLKSANWNVPNSYTKVVSSTMIYGRRMDNDGRFSLGKFRSYWLILQLNMWAISPRDTSPDLCRQHNLADAQPGGVLGLRYKLIGKESTKKTLLFFPLGKSVSFSITSASLTDLRRTYTLH